MNPNSYLEPYFRSVGDAVVEERKNPNNPYVGWGLLAMGVGLMIYGFMRPPGKRRAYSSNRRRKNR